MLAEQLMAKYKQNGKLLIAVDFDNTLYPLTTKLEGLTLVHDVVRRAKEQGHTIMLFTCRHTQEVTKPFCVEHGLDYDYFNESPVQDVNVGFGKIYYNILLDDKAGLWETVSTLNNVLNEIAELIR